MEFSLGAAGASVNQWVVYAFLAFTFIVGIWAGRGIKTIKEYAVANKVYGTGVLTMSFLATQISAGAFFSDSKAIVTDGILQIVMVVIGLGVGALFIGRFFVPKMNHFSECVTLGEVIGKLYGKRARILTGLVGFLFSICFVGVQILALSYVFEGFMGVNRTHGILLGGALVVLYASFGGIKSVTITDVVQFIMLIVVVPLIGYLVSLKVGGQEKSLPRPLHSNFVF